MARIELVKRCEVAVICRRVLNVVLTTLTHFIHVLKSDRLGNIHRVSDHRRLSLSVNVRFSLVVVVAGGVVVFDIFACSSYFLLDGL